MDSWFGMDFGEETSEYTTVRIYACRLSLCESADYARNVPVMLESVSIMLALCSIFPRSYYTQHYAGIICPSLTELPLFVLHHMLVFMYI